jgi:hypothetical protein
VGLHPSPESGTPGVLLPPRGILKNTYQAGSVAGEVGGNRQGRKSGSLSVRPCRFHFLPFGVFKCAMPMPWWMS